MVLGMAMGSVLLWDKELLSQFSLQEWTFGGEHKNVCGNCKRSLQNVSLSYGFER